MKEKGAAPTAYLMDNNGSLGKLYAAKTTPHMFIVDPQGKLIYNGAVDDKPTTDMTVKADKNYVQLALNDALAGRPIAEATTRPYGCSVKY
ncbi:hypothetical protein [Candidatus Cyanaurora vandensis]|uniref:hypothetical protein n=1 Tax=Candidatus Cyanaurora vandensis TaxID=2714958 RepID=UPI00257E888F|nr:hypothetical protein [Candidatus Cyanaurora vandensis]